jgi:hypothetical protein
MIIARPGKKAVTLGVQLCLTVLVDDFTPGPANAIFTLF